MKILVYLLLFSVSLICVSCIINYKSNNNIMKLDITLKQLSKSVIEIDGQIHSNDSSSIAFLLHENYYDQLTDTDDYWYLTVNFNDSIRMESRFLVNITKKFPTYDDYMVIDSNEIKTIKFIIDIKNLIFITDNYKENIKTRNGTYTFQLKYHDVFHNHPLAVEIAKSNKVVFNYVE